MNEKVEIDANLLEQLKHISGQKNAVDRAVDSYRQSMTTMILDNLLCGFGLEEFRGIVVGAVRVLIKYGVPIQDTISCIRELALLADESEENEDEE